jgi:hypothetical protein
MKIAAIILAVAYFAYAQTTRQVSLSWTASTSTGVTGYTIATASSAAGPFTQVGCVGTVAGSTCLAGSTSATTNYNDTETVGTTVYYQVVAVAAACTPTTPVGQGCGDSPPATVNTTVPPKPTAVTTIVVVVQ